MTEIEAMTSVEVPPEPDEVVAQVPLLRDDEAEIWHVIESEHVAFWSRNYAADAAFHAQTPYEQLWGWSPDSGVTVRRGWAEIGCALREDFATLPDPMPFMFDIERKNKTIRIVGDMAWVTFDEVYPTDNLPSFRGSSGCIRELRILERRKDGWKITFTGILDAQFGQMSIPSWQIDVSGRVLRQNAAATYFMKTESELVVRSGCLHFRDAKSDKRFRATIKRVENPDGCLLFGSDAAPFVYDPGNDEPARTWWILAHSGELIVTFNDPVLVRDRLEVAANAFGLSPSQQRLAASIISGLALTEAARREGVRASTARTQLQRIYDKVGVRTQPALVQALLTATIPG